MCLSLKKLVLIGTGLFCGTTPCLSADYSNEFDRIEFQTDQVRMEPVPPPNQPLSEIRSDPRCSKIKPVARASDYEISNMGARIKSIYIDQIDGMGITATKEPFDPFDCLLVVPIKIPDGFTIELFRTAVTGPFFIRRTRHKGSFSILIGSKSTVADGKHGFSKSVFKGEAGTFILSTNFEKKAPKDRLKFPCAGRKNGVFDLYVMLRVWVVGSGDNDGQPFQSFLGANSVSVLLKESGQEMGKPWRVIKCPSA